MTKFLMADRLYEVLDYDSSTGIFRWKVELGPAGKIGTVAGCMRVGRRGGRYIVLKIDRRLYLAHRLAWFWVHGEWPIQGIDHINGDGEDNRIVNLRPATQTENNGNARRYRNNTSGFKGVAFYKRNRKWQAKITKNGHQIHLGFFENPEEAHAAYTLAATKLFGEFARTQ